MTFDCMRESLEEHHGNLAKEMSKVHRSTFTCFCRHLKEKFRRKLHGVKSDYDSPMESNSSDELGFASFHGKKKHGRPDSDYATVGDVMDHVQQTEPRNTDSVKGNSLTSISRSDVKRTAFKEKTYDNVKMNT